MCPSITLHPLSVYVQKQKKDEDDLLQDQEHSSFMETIAASRAAQDQAAKRLEDAMMTQLVCVPSLLSPFPSFLCCLVLTCLVLALLFPLMYNRLILYSPASFPLSRCAFLVVVFFSSRSH